MPGYVSPLRSALVIMALLLSLVPPATMAQSECPQPLVKDPNQDICIDPESGLYVAPEDYPTEVSPPPPTEPPVSPEGDLARFTLYHLACDNDFDPNGVRDAGGLGPTNGCLTYGKPPFTYTISANGTPITTATLDATERDFARLHVPGLIPAGTLTITIAPVAGYTTEFISCGLEIGEAGTDVIEPLVADGTTTLSTLPDQKVECWVYNVTRVSEDGPGDPDPDAEPGAESTPTPTIEQDATGPEETLLGPQEAQASPAASAGEGDAESEPAGETGLTVLTRRCPPEAAGPDVVPNELCTEPATGLTFEILVDDESIGMSVSDANGDLAIPGGAGAGMYLFRHQPAADLLEMKTECSSVYPNGATATGRSSAVGPQMSGIFVPYDDASRVTCTFYFVMVATARSTGDAPEAAEGQATPPAAGADASHTDMPALTLTFRTCPDGADQAADPAALEQTCAVETGERFFILTRDNVTTSETVVGTGTWTFTDPVVYVDIGGPTRAG